jgi:hypothetical protein
LQITFLAIKAEMFNLLESHPVEVGMLTVSKEWFYSVIVPIQINVIWIVPWIKVRPLLVAVIEMATDKVFLNRISIHFNHLFYFVKLHPK